MILTVAEALKRDVFKGARVVAGQAGLNHTVTWVHNSGVPNAAEWLNGGELVLTTIINMPESEEGRIEYLQAMIDKGVAALIITTGNLLKEVPDYLVTLAESHNFPLIEIPFQARFVDIARSINEHIAQENMAMVRRAMHIQQTLTQIVLDGGGIHQLATTLAGLVGQSISIETRDFEALASVNIAAVDEARRYTQQFGRTDPRLVAALEDQVLPEIRRTLRPVFIPQMPHVGLEMERILAPIVVHGEIYGFMWIIADDRPLSDLDHVAIESGATIAALMMLYQESIQNAEASLKGNLLTRLVQGETNGGNTTVILSDQALRYGVDLRRLFRVLMLEHPGGTAQQVYHLYRRINRMASDEAPIIAGQFAGQVMLLAQADAELQPMLERILRDAEAGLRIAVSGEHKGANAVSLAYDQCREALIIAGRMAMSNPVVYFDDLGYLHTLYYAGPNALRGNPHMKALRALHAEQQADLFHTLEVYLDAGGNGVQTAEILHIHRSTLMYRLQRITEICQVELSDPLVRTNLQVAIKLLRLFDTG